MESWDSFVKNLRRNLLPKAIGVKRVTQPQFTKIIEETYLSEFNIKLGCCVSTIQKWEAGDVIPSPAAQMAILKLAENVKAGKLVKSEKI